MTQIADNCCVSCIGEEEEEEEKKGYMISGSLALSLIAHIGIGERLPGMEQIARSGGHTGGNKNVVGASN